MREEEKTIKRIKNKNKNKKNRLNYKSASGNPKTLPEQLC